MWVHTHNNTNTTTDNWNIVIVVIAAGPQPQYLLTAWIYPHRHARIRAAVGMTVSYDYLHEGHTSYHYLHPILNMYVLFTNISYGGWVLALRHPGLGCTLRHKGWMCARLYVLRCACVAGTGKKVRRATTDPRSTSDLPPTTIPDPSEYWTARNYISEYSSVYSMFYDSISFVYDRMVWWASVAIDHPTPSRLQSDTHNMSTICQQ